MAMAMASSFFHTPLITTGTGTGTGYGSPMIIFPKPILHNPSTSIRTKPKLHIFTTLSSPQPQPQPPAQDSFSSHHHLESEYFDWYAHWYPVALICDLDKTRPHGRKVMGMDIVIWYDRKENGWKVFQDTCPHRLAPLSEGRIDEWGRLQCVYHGWCFAGAGDCKFIPQAPRDGPPIHTSKKACVVVYPSCLQNGIVWFWPNADPQHQDMYLKEKPPYIPELDDPSFFNPMMCRDIPYGYEVLIENLMDPAHLPYAHYGIMALPETPESLKADREGGIPIEKNVTKLDINGFTGEQDSGHIYFIPPCLFYGRYPLEGGQSTSRETKNEEVSTQKRSLLIFYCIPVSPGNSRLIMATPKNFAVWPEQLFPRWIFHLGQNLVIDSDLYLLHLEERKLVDVGSINWHKACFVPTKADAYVIAFRTWLIKYARSQVDWRGKFSGQLPPTPPREQLFDRFWSHTVKCSSCNRLYTSLNAIKVALQVMSLCLIGTGAAGKMGIGARYGMVTMAVVCFVASKWVAHFVYKSLRYHDYDHTLGWFYSHPHQIPSIL